MNNEHFKINIAIIGFGKMGGYHLNALRDLQEGGLESYYKGNAKDVLSRIEVCGLCDIVRSEDNKGRPFYTDYRDLIRENRPDIAVIATPTDTHFEIARFALENGVNIFVEKPIVVHKAEFDELLGIASAKGLKIMAGHVERYNPVPFKLREMLGGLEKSEMRFRFTRSQPHDERIVDDIIVDKLIHDLDMSLFLFGPILNYEILAHKKYDGTVYELRLGLEHDNSEGEIFVSWLETGEVCRKLRMRAGEKLFEGDFLNKTLRVDGVYIDCEVPQWIESRNNQVKDELVDFIVSCYGSGTDLPKPLLTTEDISSTVTIIEDISKTLNSN